MIFATSFRHHMPCRRGLETAPQIAHVSRGNESCLRFKTMLRCTWFAPIQQKEEITAESRLWYGSMKLCLISVRAPLAHRRLLTSPGIPMTRIKAPICSSLGFETLSLVPCTLRGAMEPPRLPTLDEVRIGIKICKSRV